jgi:hypothetical protein
VTAVMGSEDVVIEDPSGSMEEEIPLRVERQEQRDKDHVFDLWGSLRGTMAWTPRVLQESLSATCFVASKPFPHDLARGVPAAGGFRDAIGFPEGLKQAKFCLFWIHHGYFLVG